MGRDHALDRGKDFAPVLEHLADRWPDHLVLSHVIPAHLVDARLENIFHVSVDGSVEEPGQAKLVDVQHGDVAVVEDLGVPETVDRRLPNARGEERSDGRVLGKSREFLSFLFCDYVRIISRFPQPLWPNLL